MAAKAYYKNIVVFNMEKVRDLSDDINDFLDQVPKDLNYLVSDHSLMRYLQWEEIGEKSKAKKWYGRTEATFYSFIKSRKIYKELIIIDSDGREMINIGFDKGSNLISLPSGDELQSEDHSEYFKETVKLRKGRVFVSDIELSKEGGNIETPYTPVIHYAMPIIDQNSITKGIILLTVYAEEFLKPIVKEDIMGNSGNDNKKDMHLADKYGYYIYHHNKSLLWGRDTGVEHSVENDHPVLFNAFQKESGGTIVKDGLIQTFRRVYPLPDNSDIYWVLYSQIEEKIAFKKLNHLKYIFILLLLSVLFFIFLVTRHFFNSIMPPLLFVTGQLKKLSQGELSSDRMEYGRNDEIGEMLASYRQLLKNIRFTISQANAIASGDYTQEVQPLSVEDQLGMALMKMTHTLRDLSLIAKSVSVGDFSKRIEVRSEKDALSVAINRMTDNLREITLISESIAVGDYSKNLQEKSDEDALSKSINRMILTLQGVVKQANSIAKGDYTISIEPAGQKDELALALQTMTFTLKENERINREHTWLKDGINELKNIMLGNQDVRAICSNALNFVASYTDSAVGALFLYEKERDRLRRFTTYAVSEGEDLAHTFKLGEGIIGQAALQDKPILLKNIRKERLTIVTGTTSEPPLNSYTFPLSIESELHGVMELASHEEFDELKLEFFQNCRNAIATAISLALQADRVKELLEASQRANEELQIRGEELETANTELEQQREQLEIQTQELKEKNEMLTRTQKELDIRSREIEIASKYKSDFMANMSHELRTPLNSIILLSRLMSRNQAGKLSADEVKKLQVIHSSGEELHRLINDLLDLSKIESGKMSVDFSQFSSQEFISSFRDIFDLTAEEKGITFKIEDKLDGVITSDKEKLSQIIRNLLSNAFKFTKEGSVHLSIEKSKEKNLPLLITVKDSGIGIAEEKQTLIFDAFQQADGSTSREFGGTGLGLSICRELAGLLKGTIELKSEEGTGSEFSLLLPEKPTEFRDGEKNSLKHEKRRAEDDRKNILSTDKVILIIDDDEKFCNIVKDDIHNNGFKALIALNGEDGITLSKEYLPMGIMLDLGLPDVSGIKVLRELKAYTETAHIPVHIISGKDYDPSLLDLGAKGFTQKPVEYETVEQIINSLVQTSHNSGKKLLIVEDNEIEMEHIVELVKDKNIEATGVTTVHEAKKELDENSFDSIIVDLRLKDGNGLDFCKYIKERRIDVPVIIYTGRSLTEEEEAELKKFSASIITKTVHSEKRLKEEIEVFLHKMRKKSVPFRSEESAKSEKSFEGKTILIADDDPKNIFVISSALEEQGVQTIPVMNGKKALEELKRNKGVDLILMDIMMPVMDGYEAIKLIRKDEELKHIPIIAVTAKAMKEDKSRCIDAGADDYITKPINYDVLTRILEALLFKV